MIGMIPSSGNREGSAPSKRNAYVTCRNIGAALGLVIATTMPAFSESGYIPSTPEPGSEIPESTIQFGMKPYADNSFYVIAMKKGWFEDVGITISPEGGTTLTEDTANAMIINGNIDITGQFPPMSLPTYRTSDAIKQIMFTDVIVSASILASPDLGLKTFKDYIGEGMSFDEAIRAALEPTKKGRLVAPSAIVERVFEDAVTRFSGVEFNLDIMEDSQILVAARARQIEFAHPGGAPIVYSLIQDGWVQLVSLADLLEHAPRDPDSPIIPTIFIVGNVGNAEFINNNQTTVLRFMSVVWRTIDELAKDPSLYDLQAPYLNSVAGTSLSGEDIAATVSNFHPYTTFGDTAKYYEEGDSLLYYRPIYTALINEFRTNGILKDDSLVPEDYIWGRLLWQEMVSYKAKAGELLAGLEGTDLTDSQKAMVEESRKHYGWHNYLDAYRIALAATES